MKTRTYEAQFERDATGIDMMVTFKGVGELLAAEMNNVILPKLLNQIMNEDYVPTRYTIIIKAECERKPK